MDTAPETTKSILNALSVAGNSKKLSPREMERITKSYYDIDVLKNIRGQLNDDRRMKNLDLPLSNRVVNPIEEVSRGAAVYKGVSEKEVKELFMRLGGVNKIPEARENNKFKHPNGSKAIYYTLETKQGDKLELRNYSSSQKESNSKWNIDITSKGGRKIELKFQ